MELKVWVEGIQRIVCGVTDVTTCQDVVYALAHATGKTGRFTLMERWRNSERLLAPNEHPLKILLKWGEYASDVQFILQRTALETKSDMRPELKTGHAQLSQQQQQQQQQRPAQIVPGGPQRITPKATPLDPPPRSTPQSPLQSRDIKKSLTFSGGHSSHLPLPSDSGMGGISPHGPEVGGIPQGFMPKVSPLQNPYSHSPVLEPAGGGAVRSHHPSSGSSRHGFSVNRPPAPPPYELVRGHPPPPPPSGLGMHSRHPFHQSPPPATFHGSYAPTQNASKDRRNQQHPPMRSPPPYPPPSFRAPHSNPNFGRPMRELPPYRDPPPPPPPSHPALMKISPPKSPNQYGISHPPSSSATTLPVEGSQQPQLDHIRRYPGAPHGAKVSDAIVVALNTSLPESSSGSPKSKERVLTRESLSKLTKVEDSPKTHVGPQRSSRVHEQMKKEEGRKQKEGDEYLHSDSPANSSFEHPKHTKSDERPNSPTTMTPTPVNNSTTPNNNKNHHDSDHKVIKDMYEKPGDINDNLINTVKTNKGGVGIHKNLKQNAPVSSSGRDGEKSMVQSIIKQLVKSSTKELVNSVGTNHNIHSTEEVVVDNYYKELVKLVNAQREKITAQQVDLTKYEAEIAFTEGRWKEEESRLSYLQEEIKRLEEAPEKQVDTKLLAQLEEQLKTAKKAESTSQEEVKAIQKKMAACDLQLSQMNARVISIQEALQQEELTQKQKQQEILKEEEQDAIMREIEKLQTAVEQASKQAEHMQAISQQLNQEMLEAESRLEDKRKEIESLKQAMREANLEALSMTPPDEAKALSESRTGNSKTGTNRRMVGSPRQLETAVPTSKNPHGVWV